MEDVQRKREMGRICINRKSYPFLFLTVVCAAYRTKLSTRPANRCRLTTLWL